MQSILRKFVKNPVFSNLLMVFLLVAGILAGTSIPREIFPEFSLDLIVVNILYPSASPDEVEESVCVKLENEFEGLEGISKITSTAVEGSCSTLIEVESSAETYKVKDDIKNAVDRITTFPKDVEDIQIKEIINKRLAGSIALYGDAPEKTLREVAREIKDDLIASPFISQVSISGIRDYEISIEVSEKTLSHYGLTFDQIVSAIKKGSLDMAGGKLRTKDEEIVIRTKGEKYRGEEFRDIVVLAKPDGSILRLHEIAKITDGFVEDARFARFRGKSAVMIEVSKTSTQDVIKISSEVEKYIERKNKTLPRGLNLESWWDNSKVVRDRLDLLIKNGVMGLALVFFSLWFFLDIRLSGWVAMGIPVSFSGALWIMKATGQTLNMLSMFALLMVVGMIVDDAIVIGENIYTHIMRGVKPWDAVVSGTVEVVVPVVASTATTLAAFYPLFMVGGIMGKFIRVIPITVVSCLLASLVEAIIILPIHLRHAKISQYNPDLPVWKRIPCGIRKKINDLNDFAVHRIYGPFYDIILKHRMIFLSVALALLMLTAGILKGGYIEFVFFPKGEEEVIYAKLAYPFGTPLEVTKKAIEKIEQGAIKTNTYFKDREEIVEKVSSILGELGGHTKEQGPHLGQVSMKLTSSEERAIGSEEVKNRWRKIVGKIPGIESLTFETPRHGPGGKPIDIMFLSRDFDELRKTADEMKEFLGEYPGLFDIQTSFHPGKRELKVKLKDYAYSLGLTLRDVALQLRQGFYGAEAARIQRGTDDLKVMVRYPISERNSIENLNLIRIRTPRGDEVPFREVASYKIEAGYSKITRENGMRVIHVVSDLDESKNNARKIVQDLKIKILPLLAAKHPSVSYKFEGQEKERKRTVADLVTGSILALLVMYSIIAVMFKSYSQPLVIMLSIPFGVVGAILGHGIMGKDLSIMSFFGIVALSGIVVNDSLVLVDFINNSVKSGAGVVDAVSGAGRARFRAVMLTSVTTVAGLFPLIIEKSFQAQFLIPMAISLSFGLMFSTVVTLFMVPSVYLVLNDIKRIIHWLLKGTFPSREAVEPCSFKDFVQ